MTDMNFFPPFLPDVLSFLGSVWYAGYGGPPKKTPGNGPPLVFRVFRWFPPFWGTTADENGLPPGFFLCGRLVFSCLSASWIVSVWALNGLPAPFIAAHSGAPGPATAFTARPTPRSLRCNTILLAVPPWPAVLW